jgi:SpoVK/Ycf46/Vps4 family AAA+-type ATPase
MNSNHKKSEIDNILKEIWGEDLFAKVQTLIPKNSPMPKNSNESSEISKPEQGLTPQKKIERSSLIGQNSAMNALNQVVSLVKLNKERAARKLPPFEVNLHCVFAGSPGTGKTTFARFFAQEIKELGFLKSGHLVEVSRADLIAEFTGQTAKKTSEVVQKSRGGILFIDEAYSLKNSKDDSFGQECIDTLVKLIEDFRSEMIVILAGYTEEIRTFLHHNTGLKSRIPHFIQFGDYNDDELGLIFDSMLKKISLNISPLNRTFILKTIAQKRRGRSFGNAREVRNIIESALAQQAVRLSQLDLKKLTQEQITELIYSDFTPDAHDIQMNPSEELKVSAADQIQKLKGLTSVKQELISFIDYLKIRKIKNTNPSASPNNNLAYLHLILSGNPGTGRNTLAHIMGNYYCELGLLAQGHVVVADRASLVAGFTGQTAIKTREKILEALGGILLVKDPQDFIKGPLNKDDFGSEAFSALISGMQEFKDKLAVIFLATPPEAKMILANYPQLADLTKTLFFENLTPDELFSLAIENAQLSGYFTSEGAKNKLLQLIIDAQKNTALFSNSKFVLKLLDDAYKKHASRIMKLYTEKSANPNHPDLNQLESDDFDIIKSSNL